MLSWKRIRCHIAHHHLDGVCHLDADGAHWRRWRHGASSCDAVVRAGGERRAGSWMHPAGIEHGAGRSVPPAYALAGHHPVRDPMPAGVYVGLQLYGMLDQSALQLVIAGFVLLSLLVRVPGAVAGRAFPAWAYLPAGFLIGGANMLVGVLAPILGAILRFERLDKERTVGTLGFFGFAGNVFKTAGFVLVGFSFADYLPMIACASLATILGNLLGRRLLGGISSAGFAAAFRIMLGLLALKLVWDALSGPL